MDISDSLEERKSKRKSTQAKSLAVEARRRQEAESSKGKRRIKKEEEREITQEELLEEAKQTEIENIKSLERFVI